MFRYIMLSVIVMYMSRSVFFFNQKTAYEMRISDWSSDVCSSDLRQQHDPQQGHARPCVAARDLGAGDLGAIDLGLKRIAPCIADFAMYFLTRKRADQIGRASCRERVCQYV